MIRTLIALPYEIARLPLAIVDRNVADRLPETSASRVTLDRAIGSVDRIAGAVLRNEHIARRGADRIDRSAKLIAAAQLEEEAAARRTQAERDGRRRAACGDRASGRPRRTGPQPG